MSILFKNASILTMNDKRDIYFNSDLRVEADRISQIGKLQALHNEKVIDAKGSLLMPGLINAHSHIAMSLFRNFGNDRDLHSWLNDYIWPLEAIMTAEDAAAGVRLSLLEMAVAGITTFVDMYDFEEITAKEAAQIGMRAYLAPGITDRSLDRGIWQVKDLKEKYEDYKGLIKIMIGPHAVYTCNPDSLKKLKNLAEDLDLKFHIHLSETEKEERDCYKSYGKSPSRLLADLGIIEEGSILAHGIYLSEQDMDLIAKKKATIVYNPASNLKLGSGILPFDKLIDKGINVAIGTDGPSSNNCQDLFRDMTIGSFIQKGFNKDPQAAPASEMLELATVNGAKALGRSHDLGSLEEGKLADIIMLSFDKAHNCPMSQDIEAALVYSGKSEDVKMTMVKGKIIYYKGRLLTADEEEIKDQAVKARDRLMARRS